MKNTLKTLFLFLVVVTVIACGKDDEGGDGGGDPMGDNLSVTLSPISKFEGDDATTEFEFKVRLSEASTEVISVDYETQDGSATAGEDYEATAGTLTFNGTTQQIITVNIITDTLSEGDEEFEVVLSNPTLGVTLERSSVVGTIRNDDDFVEGGDEGYTTPDSYAGMTLVWQDEFNGSQIDPDSWTHELGNSGWGNNELQNYTASSANSYLSDGKLIIEAREENSGGSQYSSARIITAGKREFAFGRIDIRAKLPEGQGIWPAIWMLGANFFTNGWPSCGEVDIMELVGHEPGIVHGTAHWGPQGSPSINNGNAYSLGGPKFSEAFHVFTIIWESNRLRWYVDDNLFFTLTQSEVGSPYPFNDAFFFILNIAVGGNWPGSPDASTVFPQRMFIDYIRVFQE